MSRPAFKYFCVIVFCVNILVINSISKALSDAGPADVISLYYSNRPPYYIIENGSVSGITAKLTEKIFKEENILFQWIEKPSKRQLQDIQINQNAICAPGWFWRKERAEYGLYTEAIYQDGAHGVIGRTENALISKHASLSSLVQDKDLTILTSIGFSYGDFIDQLLLNITPSPMSVSSENSKMLQLISYKRADYMFITPEEANYLLSNPKFYLPAKLTLYTDFNDSPIGERRYIICSKKVGQIVIDKLDKAINKLISH